MSDSFRDRRMATLIVRLSWPMTGGRLTGIVERVATGEKRRFHDLKGLGVLIDGVVGSRRSKRRRTDRRRT